jgi:hypothetical protein
MLDQNHPIMELEECRFPAYTTEPIFPSLIAVLWSSTNAGFRRRKLERNQAIERYGLKRLLRIARETDKPHILKYMCNKELERHIRRINKDRSGTRQELLKVGLKKNIPLEIIRSISINFFPKIK